MDAPTLPRAVRAFNSLGRGAARLGIRPGRLDAASLLAAVSKQAGLSDFGDAGFRPRLDLLVRSLEEEGRLSAMGRLIVRRELVAYLERRVLVHDWRVRHPEIGEGVIARPIFIVGQGRTGTTILHELLALDPDNRVPLTWEVDHPSPPPERATFDTDARIARSQHTIDRSESLIPDFKRMHRMGARLPQECVRMTAMECASMIFPATWRVPTYTRWLVDEAQMRRVYAAHRRMLQHLQWHCPARRWVLKSPGHLWHLNEMLAEYPDALLIQTHRDPLRVLSSLTSLEVVLRAMVSDDVDVTDVAREWSEWFRRAYERSVTFRESGVLPPARVIDLQFREFIRDPVAQVRRIYEHFGLELTPAVAARMQSYVAANPSNRDGAHVHSFDETGLDRDAEREKVRRYQEYFDVPAEG